MIAEEGKDFTSLRVVDTEAPGLMEFYAAMSKEKGQLPEMVTFQKKESNIVEMNKFVDQQLV